MVLATAALLLVACGGNQNTNKEVKEDVAEVAELVKILPDDFDAKAGEYVGKEVQVVGTIVHVCAHGGKRMFVFGEDSDLRVKITADDEMAAFNTEWEGSEVAVVGVVDEFRIDEEYLATWQAEIEEKIATGDMEHSDEDEGLHTGEDGHEQATPEDELAQIDGLRNEIAESGTDHLSYYSISCKSFEVMEFDGDSEDHEHSEGEATENHEHSEGDGHDHDGHNH
ncbi:Uncharacterised protein [Candidatus Venteria ishoeyi]|uniref:Uncharacterized protein n=2 Tax=Candidatus Venteria ishoeyi TaxID=1899563 RepID=A0A1H6F8F7_9GAMM|nr:Uncharacterised protein [Candidatus Venteria ishoeyi]